jgi:hypothetical protein
VVGLALALACLGLPLRLERPVRAEPQVIVKVMPLGDSITSGTGDYASYRCVLYKSMVAKGYSVNFTGTSQGQWGILDYKDTPPPAYCNDFDWGNEGHSGWRVDHILKGDLENNSWPGKLSDWATLKMPDVVLVHLGTNDLGQGQSVESTVSELGQVIDTLRAANPNVKILLAQIIPGKDIPNVPALNAALPGLAANKWRKNSPVLIVDQYTGFDIATDTRSDGVHPNESGEQKMAAKWLAGYERIIKPIYVTYVPDVMK